MEVSVKMRINRRTGELELFEVDQDEVGTNAEHNAAHEAQTIEIGRVLTSAPVEIEEVFGAGAGRDTLPADKTDDDADETEGDRRDILDRS